MAFIVHMEHGLDVQQAAHKCSRRTDTAAALEIFQIIHGEPVVNVQAGVFGKLCRFLDRGAGILAIHGQLDQQALPGRSGKRIDGKNLPIRVLLPQLGSSHLRRMHGGAQAGRKAEVKKINALVQLLDKRVAEHRHIDCGCTRNAAFPDLLIEFRKRPFEVQMALRFVVKLIAQTDKGNAPFFKDLRHNIRSRIRHNYIISHNMQSFPPECQML